MKIYKVNLCIQPEFGKMRTIKTLNKNLFHAVFCILHFIQPDLNPLSASVALILKPVNWSAVMTLNGLKVKSKLNNLCNA